MNRSQEQEIENLLRSRYGQEIPVYELAALALQYNSRINSIRRRLKREGGFEEIPQPRAERVNGQLHTWYCIRRVSSTSRPAPEPIKDMTAPADSATSKSDDWYTRQTGKSRQEQNSHANDDLPIFAVVRP